MTSVHERVLCIEGLLVCRERSSDLPIHIKYKKVEEVHGVSSSSYYAGRAH